MTNPKEIVLRLLRSLAESDGIPELAAANENTPLFGGQGVLDSAALVFLVTEIEEAVAAEFGVDIVVVDEKTFARSSPFRNVSSLSAYLEERIASARE